MEFPPMPAVIETNPNGQAKDHVDLSDPAAFVTELSAADKFFEAQAIAKVRIGSKIVAFKIRSISKEALEQVMMDARPRNLPKMKNAQGNLVVNEEAPQYRQWLLTYGYLKVLLGFADLTLKDRAGRIVWQVPGEIHEAMASVQALKDLGITTHQVEDLSRQIDALSLLEAEEDSRDFF